MANSSGTNTRHFQFHLNGDSLASYSSFKVYLQAQRSLTGAQTVTLAYSVNGSGYINLPTTFPLPVEGSFYEMVFDLPNIPAINNPITLDFRLLASGASGTGSLRIDNFQVQGSSPSSTNDLTNYFRSKASGDWSSVNTWEMSSDQLAWVDATITPNYNSNTIEILNTHTITLNNNQIIDQTIINIGAVLRRTGGLLTINNGAGDDLVINGTFNHDGAVAPTINGTCLVKTNGVMQVDLNTAGLSDLLAGNGSLGKVFYENQATFFWNNSDLFSSDNQTYFPGVSSSTIPIFKIGQNTASIGANAQTTFNGIFEANGNISFQNLGTKTFRNGIRGTGIVTQANATTGPFLITGSTAELGGTGKIMLNTKGMKINPGSVTTLISKKEINGGTFTIAGNATLDAVTDSLYGTTNFTMNFDASLITAHKLGINGSIRTLNQTFSLANFIFNGSTEQQQTGGLMPETINNLTINNPFGVRLVQYTVLGGSLTFATGHLFLGASAFYDLYLSGSINGADATKFVVTNSDKTATSGFLMQNASGGKLFPIGSTSAADDYTPAFVIADATNPIYKARVFDKVYVNGTGNSEVTQQNEIVKKTWQILPQLDDGTADITIQWNAANEGTGFQTTRLDPLTTFNLHITGTSNTGTWTGLDPSVFDDTEPFTLSNTGIGSDTYTFFTANSNPNVPLPISLLSFGGNRVGNGIKLDWKTTAEVNSAGFEVQRSADLKDFVSIGFVQSVQPGKAENRYTFTDENISQGSYYRLKQIDQDGQYQYNKPIFVEGNSSLAIERLLVYPNPTEGKVHLALPDNVAEAHLKLVSANGITLAEFTALPALVDAQLSEHLTRLPAGLYSLQTIQGSQFYRNKLLKR
ncbi:MAG: T9SS type A sorting domain-containing protein [Bacteroidota bacterium]